MKIVNYKKTISLATAASFALAGLLACSEPPPEQELDGGDGDKSTDGGDGDTGDGDTTPGDGDGDGDGDTPDLGDRIVPQTAPPFGHPDPATTYPTHEGFTLWLVEEFEEALDLDKDPIWTWSDGGLGEGQVRFVKDGIKFQDGKMMLEVKPDESEIPPQACSHAEVGTVFSKELTSGEMRTRHNLFRYGRYEVRMKAPSVKPGDTTTNGNYIATLFAFRTPKFEQWREIDIEVTGDVTGLVDGMPKTPLTTNLITGDGYYEWDKAIQQDQSFPTPDVNVRSDFHDFAFEWTKDRIAWYFDGELVREQISGTGLPIPEMSTKIMMNLWIFGSSGAFGGEDILNNEYPMHSEYEWFRFYKWNEETEYPCLSMNSACLKEGDKNLSSNNPCDEIPHGGTVNGTAVCVATCN